MGITCADTRGFESWRHGNGETKIIPGEKERVDLITAIHESLAHRISECVYQEFENKIIGLA